MLDVYVGNGESEKQQNKIIEMEGNPSYAIVQKNVGLNENLCYGIIRPDPHNSMVIYETIT